MKIEIPREVVEAAKEFGMTPEVLAERVLISWVAKDMDEITICRDRSRRPRK